MEAPPVSAEGSVAASPESAPARITPLQAFLGVFVNPRRTFEAMAPRPRFLLPLVAVIIAQIVFGVAVFQSGAVGNDAIAKMEAKGDPPEQIAAMERFFDSPAAVAIGSIGGAVTVVFVLLVSAALLFFMANLMLGARLTFRHYLSVATHAAAIGLVDQAVRVGFALARGTLDIRLGLGNLLGENLGFGGRVLDTVTDPLILWSTAVAALGVSVYAKRSFGFGIAAVVPGFLLSALLSGLR